MARRPGSFTCRADSQLFRDLAAATANVVGGIMLAIQLFEAQPDLMRLENIRGAAMAMGLGVTVRVEAVGILSRASGDGNAIRRGSGAGKLLADLAIIHVLSRADVIPRGARLSWRCDTTRQTGAS